MRFVAELEKQLTPLDINFLRKVTSRINTLKISHPELNKFYVKLESGEIVMKDIKEVNPVVDMKPVELPGVSEHLSELPGTELYPEDNESSYDKVNDVVRQAVNYCLKFSGTMT